MNRDEFVETLMDALLEGRQDFYVSQTVAQMYENAIVAVDTLLPLITEAIAVEFDALAARLDTRAQVSGYALGAEVWRERDRALEAARMVRGWRAE